MWQPIIAGLLAGLLITHIYSVVTRNRHFRAQKQWEPRTVEWTVSPQDRPKRVTESYAAWGSQTIDREELS